VKNTEVVFITIIFRKSREAFWCNGDMNPESCGKAYWDRQMCSPLFNILMECITVYCSSS